jgi:3-phosphoinositide dependent protein kinase-1
VLAGHDRNPVCLVVTSCLKHTQSILWMIPSITIPDDFSPSNLAALSRNASVISTSSSDSGPSMLTTPRPRLRREFSSPRSTSPNSPTNLVARPPSYLTRELGISARGNTEYHAAQAKPRSKSRSRNISIRDFQVGETLGEGSYSTVSKYRAPSRTSLNVL